VTAVLPGRWVPNSRRAAGALGVLTMLLIAGSAVLTAVTGDQSASGAGGTIALALTFLAMGYLVARRQPRNPIGWLLMSTGLSTAFTTAAGLYAQVDYGSEHGGLPFGLAVFLAANAFWPVALITGMAAVLLFPNGRLTRPWRRALWAYAVVAVLVLVSQAIPAAVMARPGTLRAAATGHLVTMPGGATVQLLASGLPVLALLPFWVAWISRQVACFRRAKGDVREQYKWFTAGAAVSVVGIVVSTVAGSESGSGLARAANIAALYAIGVAFPLGIGVAILRYRLYEIDRVISRTLAYATATGLLVGLYAGLVLLATHVLSFKTPVAVAASTLAAAALFAPVRRRVQRIVDRRFNRARYDAERTVAAFTARLQDAVDLDTVRADLLTAVHRALEPAHASVWLPGGGQ
jgi:hypothetical protein